MLDAIGALITSLLIFFLVGGFPDIFGLEPKVCRVLGYIALGFFVYSLSNHFLVPKANYFKLRLAIIALLNLSYCLFTLSYVFGIPERGTNSILTGIGKAYFIGEIVVVMLVVALEFKIIARTKKSVVM